MIDVYNHIFTTLSVLGYPVREQGSYGEHDVLPETHITYFVLNQDDASHADNQPTSTTTAVQVALYSKQPAIVQQANQTLKAIMLPAGFLRAGGRNLSFDSDTGHYGYTSTYNFYDLEGIKMDQKYGEFVGVDSLYYALVTVNSESAYTAGTPVYLAPAAELAQAVAIGKLNTHYDNVAANTFVTEAETAVKAIVSNLDAKTLAYILGKKYEALTGRVFDAGKAEPPIVALGFRYNMGTSGYRYYWYLVGTFAGGEEAAITKKENVEIKNYELTYTAIPTTKKFEVDGETIPLKRVFGDTADEAFDEAGWFTQVQVPGAAAPAAVALSSIVPADAATGVAKNTTIVLTFNNKIAAESISLINTTSGDIVAFTKAWDTAGKVLTLTPSAALAGTTKFVVAVNGVVDVYGQALAATGKDFTTTA